MIRKIVIAFTLSAALIVAFLLLSEDRVEPLYEYNPSFEVLNRSERSYTDYRAERSVTLFGIRPFSIEATDARRSDDAILLLQSESHGRVGGSVLLNKGDYLEFEIVVAEAFVASIELEYFYEGDELVAPRFGLQIDGNYPFYESRQTSVPVEWIPESLWSFGTVQPIPSFSTDRYGSDIQPRSEIRRAWLFNPLKDASGLHAEPLLYAWEEGVHTVRLTANSDAMTIGSIALVAPQPSKSYADYLSEHVQEDRFDGLLSLEAEYYTAKSDPSIKLYSDRRPSSTAYSIDVKRLNAIDSYTWDEPGKSVTWTIMVPKEGMYHIAFKYIQYRLTGANAYRALLINGVSPFEEAKAIAFPYATDWENRIVGDEEAYWFHLNEGENEITLVSTVEPYRPVLEALESTLSEITDLSIEIRQLTGGNTDQYRDWDLTDYIPDLAERLEAWSTRLEGAYRYAHGFHGTDRPIASLVSLKVAADQLHDLGLDANDLPNRMNLLSEGSSSVSKLLGDLMLQLTKQSVAIEKWMLYGDDAKLISPRAGFFASVWNGIRLFFASFQSVESAPTDPDQTIEVWVNRPRANVDLMQQFIDEEFTPQTGIHVELSLMPNPSKLILANAANIEPDVAMGVSSQTPYQFAIRNAALDLRRFDGYEDVVAHFAPGAMIPYVFDQGVYGFPETQDFYVMFYRTDILSQLDRDIPSTWSDVVGMLPSLRRMGMNFYHPLGSSNSYKSFVVTMAFFEQMGASLYSDDGLTSALDSEASILAMQRMTELYTVHDLPKGTASFYNHFRYGNLPIGIANSQTYLQLLIAAPEIKGNWDIALYPGTEDEDGSISRYASAPTTGTMIFASSEKSELAFEFLSWWHSDETQIRFGNDIQKVFGKEYMWFSANLEALKHLSIDSSHKDVILEQLEWIVEAPNTPGGYLIEREISNAWNGVVMSDENLRGAIDDAVIAADRELWRKLEEFGFVSGLDKVRDYPIPTIHNITQWLTMRRDDE
jgi:ABC-type glycerol-3-phosphate transport system substrate-binding protein